MDISLLGAAEGVLVRLTTREAKDLASFIAGNDIPQHFVNAESEFIRHFQEELIDTVRRAK